MDGRLRCTGRALRPAAGLAGLRWPVAVRAFSVKPAIGSAGLDWRKLGFGPRPTSTVVKYEWHAGQWDGGTESSEPMVSVHLFSHCLNFGQSIFEGLKAFHTIDGRVCLFNPACNAARLRSGAARMMMPQVSDEMFYDGLERTVRANIAFMPPYGTGGSLYSASCIFARTHIVFPHASCFETNKPHPTSRPPSRLLLLSPSDFIRPWARDGHRARTALHPRLHQHASRRLFRGRAPGEEGARPRRRRPSRAARDGRLQGRRQLVSA